MLLVEMEVAKCVSPVVSGATVPGKGEHDIAVFVVADPVPATFRLDQVPGLTAQPTTTFSCRIRGGRPLPRSLLARRRIL